MKRWAAVGRYGAALASVAVVTVFIGQVLGRTHIANISMLYLAAVLGTATYLGRGPAIAAALGSFVSFNWFFVEPVHTVIVGEPTELFSLLLFLLTAVVTGQLAADQRARAREAGQREREAVVLYDVVRLIAERPLENALAAVAERLRTELGLAAVAIDVASGGPGRRVVAGREENAEQLRGPLAPSRVLGGGHAPSDRQRGDPGRWVTIVPPDRAKLAGSAPRPHTLPLIVGDRRKGTLALLHEPGSSFTPSDDRLLSAAAVQIAAAIEREELHARATETAVLERADQAKTALLQAVSHDLRTPLSSIMAGATSLRQKDVTWSEAEREEFLAGIEAEARRLDRLVADLLSVSRIESGSLRPRKELHDLGALVGDVVGRLAATTNGHRILVAEADGLPPVALDYVQIDQVLTNLIENATKYAPTESDVTVSVRPRSGEIEIRVTDSGPGVPAGASERIFEPFQRADAGRGKPGSGLGLAVAKRFVEAHGGRIWVESQDGGSTFAFTIPVAP